MARQIFHLNSLKSGQVDCGGQIMNAPLFLIDAFNVINENVTNVGIFRTAGQVKRVKQLKTLFFGGEKLPDNISVNDVCDSVKAFFRDLEEPLLTSALQEQFLRFAHTISRDDVRTRSILNLCRVLPSRHRETLAFFLWQMKKISERSNENKMDIKNLAIVVSLSIFRSSGAASGHLDDAKVDTALRTDVIELLIKNAEEICRLAKRSELMPSEKYSYRNAAATRKPRMNTIVGTGDLRPLVAAKVERARRKSGDGDEAAFKSGIIPPAVGHQKPLKTLADGQIDQRILPTPSSVRRPWQRKLDTSTLNMSDTVAKPGTPVSSKLSRSFSDAMEKRQAHAGNGQRRRSVGAQIKIKRGQPNTIFTGLDKAKRKSQQFQSTGAMKNSLSLSPIPPDLLADIPMISQLSVKPILQTAAVENRIVDEETEEESDGFAGFEQQKLALISSKHGPPSIFRSSSTPARDRPSIAYIRNNRGRVLEQAAKYETNIHQSKPSSSTTTATRPKTMEKKTPVPTFTQVAIGNKRRSPTKKYQTRMTTRESNTTIKL